VAKHSINSIIHSVQLQNASTGAENIQVNGLIITEAIKTKLNLNNINRKDGFSLSRSWKSAFHNLKGHKQALSKNMACNYLHILSVHGPCKDLL
jgi:hypothetical protein